MSSDLAIMLATFGVVAVPIVVSAILAHRRLSAMSAAERADEDARLRELADEAWPPYA